MHNFTRKIIKELKEIGAVVSFPTKSELDLMFLGMAPMELEHKGYFGWYCYEYLAQKKNLGQKAIHLKKFLKEQKNIDWLEKNTRKFKITSFYQ